MIEQHTQQTGNDPVSAAETRPPCLLCGHRRVRTAASLSAKALVNLWSEFGVTFSPDTLALLASRSEVAMHECLACGFRFFDPGLAGNASFYTDLQRQLGTYYASFRPEFRWALDRAKPAGLKRVLDVGCGAGAFLDLARAEGFETHGLESNPLAVEASRSKGHTVFAGYTAEFAREHPTARFDLVTAFQVLEHVPDPVSFLREAAALARPGGGVVIGVPNEDGVERICPWDPHQWPPHHVSRWRQRDLRALGARAGLAVTATGTDRMHGNELFHFWTLHNRLASRLGQKRYRGGRLLPQCLSWIYRKTGCRYFLPRRGANIYAFYQTSPNS